MTVDEFNAMTPFQRALLDELRKLRGAVEDATKALEKACDFQ